MSLRFAVTFDYLCPFARNAHEHVVAGLRDGADWQVRFLAHSLAQGHVPDDEPPVWERSRPQLVSGLLALQVGVHVRDRHPDHFLDVHEGLFAARHDHGRDIKDPAVLHRVLTEAGLDAVAVLEQVAAGAALATVQAEHEAGVRDHEVWGVPTFIAGDRAVFVRLMDRPGDDAATCRRRIERVVELIVDEPMLHEFKQTDLPR